MYNLKPIILSFSLFFIAVTVLAQETETRTPGSFTKIHSGGSWDVIVITGDRDEVRLESNNISLDKVITEVNNNTLKISLEKGNYRNVGLTVYVTVREVEGIKSTGSGSFKIQSDLTTGSLSLGNTGSGNIILKNVNTDNLSVGMTGSGNITVAGGSVGEFTLSQTGSGDFKGEGISAEKASINKTGSGQSEIGEVENLNVKSTGSGNVYYSGKPESVNVSATGSAKVIRR
ncbi:DUF2807 domain-containing protein [Aquiflexum sp. TKW24L]|uniref:head GIN domain-containing protein n=1 Tax=Aquiflexum sp. TKW24L TaxID=2942212 RepID=UPI0020BF3A93|nr:head GIN domain-containing protein [Aquiflexum sp. TKW24L]MCL6257574.1 DUF2807 domain-containing protein [Aquiflexum sp. TKW24L]